MFKYSLISGRTGIFLCVPSHESWTVLLPDDDDDDGDDNYDDYEKYNNNDNNNDKNNDNSNVDGINANNIIFVLYIYIICSSSNLWRMLLVLWLS